jgi:hypothetical protein
MIRYWVLKTRDDSDIDPHTGAPRDHWTNFLREEVVAVGWALSGRLRQRKPNLVDVTFQELVSDLLVTSYTTGPIVKRTNQAKTAARTILNFIREMNRGDKILLCQGYVANQERDVHVYGRAEIESPAWLDDTSSWWVVKRRANIQPKECDVPKSRLAQILARGSLRQTLHEIDGNSFHEACRWLDSVIALG